MTIAVAGQFLLKKGIEASTLAPNLSSIIKTIFSPYVFFGFLAYGISSIFWLFVLQRFPLSVAYPALSLTYIVILFISFFFLKEPLVASKIAGVSFIVIGVFFLFK